MGRQFPALREDLLVEVRPSPLEPLLGRFRVGKHSLHPTRPFHITLFGRMGPPGLLQGHSVFAAHAHQLVVRLHVDPDSPFLQSQPNALHDHVLRIYGSDQQDRLALLGDAHAKSLKPGFVADQPSNCTHHLFRGLGFLQVRWKTGLGILPLLKLLILKESTHQ